MTNRDICCNCEEETGYKQGYEIWQTFDGKYGHKWCVEQYDLKNKSKEMKLKEAINRLEGKLRHFDYEKKKCMDEIELLKNELHYLLESGKDGQ